jgi:hypothetical protein
MRTDQSLKQQAAHILTVFKQEWHLVRSNFEHSASALDVVGSVPEPRIEETGVVDAKLTDRRIVRNHLRRKLGRDPNLLSRSQDVKLFGVENQISPVVSRDRLPEFLRVVMPYACQVDHRRVPARAISNNVRAVGPAQVY